MCQGDLVGITVVMPAYNAGSFVRGALEAIAGQLTEEDELIVVDDASSDDTVTVCREFSQVIALGQNGGPARARNEGIRAATKPIIAFTDTDCTPASDWLASLRSAFTDDRVDAVMGRVVIPRSTFVGDCIAAMGFPAGGHVGFEKMWHVAPDGRTDHISSCNFAARQEVFRSHGVFDESFPLAAGEDAELSFRWHRAGVAIYYRPDVVVEHAAMSSLRRFWRWQLLRGRGNYHFKQRVGKVGGFVRLRLWSSANIIKTYALSLKLAPALALLLLSFLLQQWGYAVEARAGSSEWGK